MAMRVVIVEDEWLIAAALRRQMESQGYLVVGTAASGGEGLRLCREQAPDLVLMDVQMPGMDGLEATRALMQERPVCVVIVTGRAQLEEAAARAGAMSCVLKPLLANQIPPVIEGARTRFTQFLVVSAQVGAGRRALEVWPRVQQAVEGLMREGYPEPEAFEELSRYARREGVTVSEAAERLLASGGSRAVPAPC